MKPYRSIDERLHDIALRWQKRDCTLREYAKHLERTWCRIERSTRLPDQQLAGQQMPCSAAEYVFNWTHCVSG